MERHAEIQRNLDALFISEVANQDLVLGYLFTDSGFYSQMHYKINVFFSPQVNSVCGNDLFHPRKLMSKGNNGQLY